MLFFISFFKDSQTNARRPPSHIPNHPPPPPHPQYDVILKCMRFPLQGSYDFIVCLFVTYEKPCKNLFALKFEVSEHLNFVFVFFKVATEKLSKSINVHLHLTADTGDHFIRKLMNLLLGKKGAFFTSHQTFSNIFHRTWSGVIFQSDWSNVCVKSWDFHRVFSISSLLVAIKTMRVPRQYWEKKEWRQTQNKVNSYFLSFLFLRLQDVTWKKRGTPLWNYKFYTLWTPFRSFFFSLLWSVWPVIYLMVLLESAGVVGFAGKAPFSPEWTKQNKSHAQELAK